MNHLQHILNWIEHSLDCNQAERMLAVVLPVVWPSVAPAVRPAQVQLDRHTDRPLFSNGCDRSYGELTGRFARKTCIMQDFTADPRPAA